MPHPADQAAEKREQLAELECPPLGISARATVERVIDGDTLVLTIRDTSVHVRLIDCWCPEQNTPEGQAATERMKILAPAGKRCRVFIPTEHASNLGSLFTFGRVLGHVWLQGYPHCLSYHMALLGHATVEKPSR